MQFIYIPREEAFKILDDSTAVIVYSESGDLCYPDNDEDSIIRLQLNGDINITIHLKDQEELIKMNPLESTLYLNDAEFREVVLIPLINRRHEA